MRSGFILFLISLSMTANAQSSKDVKQTMAGIKSIPNAYMGHLNTHPAKEDPVYKAIVKRDTSVLPGLITILSDKSLTSIPNTCDGGFLSYGQLAFLIIHDIEHVPYAMVTGSQFDVLGDCGVLPDGLLTYLKREPEDFQKKYQAYFVSKERKDYLSKKRRSDKHPNQSANH